MRNDIIALYKAGKNEKEIKDELSLQGYNKKKINKEFENFLVEFKTVKEVFN